MLKLSFRQSQAEIMVRAASTVLFNTLARGGCQIAPLSDLAENPQYGYTASASFEEIGPKLVRITDLQDGKINWGSVPHCKCDEPENYLLRENDILFARTGATTGKTHLIQKPPRAVFASYLIRVRSKSDVNPEYLYSFFQSDSYWSQVISGKEGSAQPNVNGQKLMNIRLPLADSETQSAIGGFLRAIRARQDGGKEAFPVLPPLLAEQQLIVARIEELAAKIEEVRALRQQAKAECESLLRAVIFEFGSESVAMKELVRLREPDVHVQRDETYHFAGVYCFGRGVFKGQRKSGMDFAYPRLTRLRTGNFVYPKLMAWEGALGIVPPECDALVVSTEFPVFEIDESRVLPETLDVYFRTPSVWPILAGTSTGTNVRRRRLNPADFLNFKMPVPTMSAQLRLRQVKAKLDSIKPLRSEIATQLDALLPSILDKAFKGEL